MFRLTAFAVAFSGLCMGPVARADEAEDRAVALVEMLCGKLTATTHPPASRS